MNSYWLTHVSAQLLFSADDKQFIKSLRQLKGYSSRLKKLVEKLDLLEDLTTCCQTLTNMGLQRVPGSGSNRSMNSSL